MKEIRIQKYIAVILVVGFILSQNIASAQNGELRSKDKINIVLNDGTQYDNAILLHEDSSELFIYYKKQQQHLKKDKIDFVQKAKNNIALFGVGGGAHFIGLGLGVFTKRSSIDFALLPTGFAIGGKYYFKKKKESTKWKKYLGGSLSLFSIDFFGKSNYVNQYINVGTCSFSGDLFLSIDGGLLIMNDQEITGSPLTGKKFHPSSKTIFYPMASISLGWFINFKRNKIRF